MLGPLGRPGLSAPRRPRRQTVLLGLVLALLVCLLLGEVVDQVVNSSPAASKRDRLSWDAAAAVIAEQSAVLAPEVRALRGGSPRISADRVVLEEAAASLARAADAELGAVASLELPAPPGRLAAELVACLSSRRAGAAALRAGISEAISGDKGAVAGAASLLRAAGVDFERSDAAYGRFLSGLPRVPDPTSVPPARWVGEPSAWTLGAAVGWASALAAEPALRAHHSIQIVDLSVRPAPVTILGLPSPTTTTQAATTTTTTTTTTTLPGATTTTLPGGRRRRRAASTTTTTTTTTVPAPTTTLQLPPAGSVSVLPPTSTIAVVVVVRNDGNVEDTSVLVSATLTPRAPGAARSGGGTVRARLASLAPRSARYLVLHVIPAAVGRYGLFVIASASATQATFEHVVLEVRA